MSILDTAHYILEKQPGPALSEPQWIQHQSADKEENVLMAAAFIFTFSIIDYMLAENKGLTLSCPIPNCMALETPWKMALEHNDKRAPGEEVRIYSELIKWSDYLRITSNIKTLEAFQTPKH